MKEEERVKRLTALLVAFVMVLAACGGSDSANEPPSIDRIATSGEPGQLTLFSEEQMHAKAYRESFYYCFPLIFNGMKNSIFLFHK